MNKLIGLLKIVLRLTVLVSVIAMGAEPPTAEVRTFAVEKHTLVETMTAYGEVQPDPDSLTAITTGFAGQIQKLSVNTGQWVIAGDILAELDTDPTARVAYLQAQADVEFAKNELASKQQLLKEQLSTHSEVATSASALQTAKTALAAQQQLGTDKTHHVVRAPFDGIVINLAVSLGDRIQAGTALLSLAQRGDLLITLGIEPEDVPRMHPGLSVKIASVFDTSKAVVTQITEVHGMVNPATRLVDVVVRLDRAEGLNLLPGMRVHGVLTLNRLDTLAVPRSAVLMEEVLSDNVGATPSQVTTSSPQFQALNATESQARLNTHVYRVINGMAQRVDVRTGITSGGLIAIQEGLNAGDSVVVEGNYALEDGMVVREMTP